jgi:DNA-binding transcriptional regulator YiaG
MTQAEFARTLGVRQQTVSEWETARYQPRGASARMLSMLAEGRAPYDPGRR